MHRAIQLLGIIILFLLVSVNSSAQILPDDFPIMHTYKSGETADGYIFLTVSSKNPEVGYYNFMIDDDGQVFKYKNLKDDFTYDFKVQPNGLMSYAQFLSHYSYTGGGDAIHMVLDENMNAVDSFQLKNGYMAEAHDFQLLPNGHALAFGYYLTQMDLSDVVDGGYPNAQVSGGIVQEFDQDKNVVWQWRSWDHYDYRTYDLGKNAANQIVSRFHLNTINLDSDDNMILASPSWTIKIDRKTGEVLWELGGSGNEFSFAGVDSLEGNNDVTGHTFHRLENGNVLVYDNSPRKGTGTSEAHEYKLDESNKIAEKVRTFTPDTTVLGWHRGSAQRLSNGNTLVGWGGASGTHIPTCTEFDSLGNTVLKVYFDNPDIGSYRAVRFPYPPNSKHTAFLETVGLGNTYELMQGDTLDIGVKVKFTNLVSVGYNEFTIVTHDYAPVFPRFTGRAPMVLKKKVIMSEYSLNYLGGEISFDVNVFNISNPENITIYHRVKEGEGEFSQLQTTYNPVTGKIIALFDDIGEYIFTYPDIEQEALRPDPVWPVENALINYLSPVKLEWSPNGFYNSFNLHIATDSTFTNLVTDLSSLKSTIHKLDSLIVNQDYYWRVKTIGNNGESEWSDTAHFSSISPYIEITAPYGGEVWSSGLDYFIEWNDNIKEDVVIDLYNNNTKVSTIATVESRNAYLWTVPLGLNPGCTYHIRIHSIADEAVKDASSKTFSIDDSQCTGTEVSYLKVMSPNGGEIIQNGDIVNLEWANNTGEAVSIELHKAGVVADTLDAGVSLNTFDWTVPDDIVDGNDYRIVVSSGGPALLSDASNSDFKIINTANVSVKPVESNTGRFNIYPNPVNDILNIEYYLGDNESLSIKLYNLAGMESGTILNKSNKQGFHSLQHNMDKYPEGTYVIQLQYSSHTQSKIINYLKH